MIEPVRRALCLGVGEFPVSGEEGELGDKASLPFAADRVAELRGALELFGYDCADPGADVSADGIGARVRDVVTGAGPDDTVVVHVLSHGDVSERTGALYVVGADGGYSPASQVNRWLEEVEDFDRSRTLFLLDLCRSGVAARLPYHLRTEGGARRAWAIAACGPDQQAFNGRFTQAVAAVLRSIATGRSPIHPGWEYVPLSTVAAHVKRELRRLTGEALPQDAVATLVDLADADEQLPFFRNPGYVDDPIRRVRTDVEETVGGFLDDLDAALDPAHYLDRAAGHGPLAGRAHQGCFTGRDKELAELSAWLDGRGPGGPRVVTGSPGVGKSALLGVLVCAAHPRLRPATERLWFGVPHTPSGCDDLAVVHARQRGQAEIMASLARQLGLDPAAGDPVDAIRERARSVIVVDALDEATDPHAVMADLLRLATAPGCRLLVGMRRLPELAPLRKAAERAGGLVDLDLTPRERVRDELRRYVDALLMTAAPYDRGEFARVRRAFASAVADRLAARPADTERWGEFLVAALFTHHMVTGVEPIRTVEAASELGGQVPLRLPAMVELDLAARDDDRRLSRTVLTALAYARGPGMPLSVLEAVAPSFGDMAAGEVRAVLDRALFHLRISPDTEGNAVYRLFHQGVADQLIAARGGRASAESVIMDRLLPADRAWDAAEPYALRHAIQHAAAAGRVDELLEDPEFLVNADPATLLPELDRARADRARLSAVVYRTSARRLLDSEERSRRQILAVDAVRHGLRDLAERLSHGLTWRPVWATGSQVSPALRATLPGAGSAPVLTCATVDGRPAAVVGSYDGDVRVWDLSTGTPMAELRVDERVSALACTVLRDRVTVVTGAADGGVRVRDLATGALVAGPMTGHSDEIRTLTCTRLGGVPVAVTGSEDGTVRVWDLAAHRQLAGPLPGGSGPVLGAVGVDLDGGARVLAAFEHGASRVWKLTGPVPGDFGTGNIAVAVADRVDRAPVLVFVRADGTLVARDLATDGLLATVPTGHDGVVTALACPRIGDRTVAVTGALDGTVRVWDVATGDRLGGPFIGQGDMVCAVDGARIDDRDVVVAVDAQGTTRVWELGADLGGPGEPVVGHLNKIGAVTCTRLGERAVAVTGALDCTVRVWDLADGRPLGRPLTDTGFTGRALACARRDGRPVVVTGSPAGVRLWDLETGEQIGDPFIGRDDQAVGTVAYAGLGTRPVLVTGAVTGDVRMWDLGTGEPVGVPLTGHTAGITAMAVCARLGTRAVLVTGSDDGTLRVWDLTTRWELGRPISDRTAAVEVVACLRLGGGHLMAMTGALDGVLRVWDLATGEPDGGPLTGHGGAIEALTLDGSTRVVTGSADATVRIWDLAHRRLVETIALPDAVHALTVTSGGDLVVGMGWEVVVLSRGEA